MERTFGLRLANEPAAPAYYTHASFDEGSAHNDIAPTMGNAHTKFGSDPISGSRFITIDLYLAVASSVGARTKPSAGTKRYPYIYGYKLLTLSSAARLPWTDT